MTGRGGWHSSKGVNTSNIVIGIVKATDDPFQMGRLRVHIPSIDHEDYKVTDLPWAMYSSPLGGSVRNSVRGSGESTALGAMAYGFWAIPKVGAQVLIAFINGDSNFRVWLGCVYPPQANRSLPLGRAKKDSNGSLTDSYQQNEPAFSNLKSAGLDTGSHYKTRGYERPVAQVETDKDGTEGYAKHPGKKDNTLDPQGYCFVTPGGHFISWSDVPDFCRIRIRTTGGHQFLLDDTNERIYCSTALGKTYWEMDQDGHGHMYCSEDMSFHSDKNINFDATENINFHCGKNFNVLADENIHIAGIDIHINGSSNIFESTKTLNQTGSSMIIQTGGKIHQNGPKAGSAIVPEPPIIIPVHEPWDRPATTGKRNKYWKA